MAFKLTCCCLQTKDKKGTNTHSNDNVIEAGLYEDIDIVSSQTANDKNVSSSENSGEIKSAAVSAAAISIDPTYDSIEFPNDQDDKGQKDANHPEPVYSSAITPKQRSLKENSTGHTAVRSQSLNDKSDLALMPPHLSASPQPGNGVPGSDEPKEPIKPRKRPKKKKKDGKHENTIESDQVSRGPGSVLSPRSAGDQLVSQAPITRSKTQPGKKPPIAAKPKLKKSASVGANSANTAHEDYYNFEMIKNLTTDGNDVEFEMAENSLYS